MAKTFTSGLPSVSTGDVLTATAQNNLLTTLNSHTVPPLMRARRAALQSIANNTAQAVNFDTRDIDTGSTESPADAMFTATSNVATIKTAGVYLVTATLNFVSGSGAGPYGVAIMLNPTYSGSGDTATITAGTRITGNLVSLSSAITQTVVSCSTIYNFSASNTIGVLAYQNSGAAVNIASANEQNTLSVAFLGKVS
jgi:hypothetical protein